MALNKTKEGRDVITGCGLRLLSDDDIDTLHQATLRIFEQTGIRVESEEAVQLLHGAGATVEKKDGGALVKIPSRIVEDCINAAPATITFYGRDPADDFVAAPGRCSFTNVGVVPNVVDLETGETRSFGLKDSADAARLVDALDEIKIFERAGLPGDAPEQSVQLHNFAAMLKNTSKHIMGCAGTPEKLRAIIDMAAASVGGMETFKKRPHITVNVTATSPLMLLPDCTEVTMEAARNGVNVVGISMCLAGATSPVTLAGTIVQSNVEILSLLILTQLVNPGTPFTYSQTSIMMDMKTGMGALGAPETGLINAAATQLAQHYGLPVWAGGGGYTDSKIADPQALLDGTLNALYVGLAGASVIMGGGGLNQILTLDYAKLVLDAEMFRYAHKLIDGVRIDEQTLALDVIDSVGPGGHYLMEDHTLENMRELSDAGLFDRQSMDQWISSGSTDMYQRAKRKARELLRTHTPKPLPPGVEKIFQDIITEFEEKKTIEINAGSMTGG